MTLTEALEIIVRDLADLDYLNHAALFEFRLDQVDLDQVAFTAPAVFVLIPRADASEPQRGTVDWRITFNLLLLVDGENRTVHSLDLIERLAFAVQANRWTLADRAGYPKLLGIADVTRDVWAAEGIHAQVLRFEQTLRTGDAAQGVALRS